MKELDLNSVENSELLEETFKFWFTSNEHIRTPFPEYIRQELKKTASSKFKEWASQLNNKAKEEVNDEIIAEKLEELIFETALGLVLTEDEKITIQYPFLPRISDEISAPDNKMDKSWVVDRYIFKEGDFSYLKVKLENQKSKEIWETEFQLPV